MNVLQLIEALQALGPACYEHQVMDTDANPVISVNKSDDDVEAGLNRVYIEAEF